MREVTSHMGNTEPCHHTGTIWAQIHSLLTPGDTPVSHKVTLSQLLTRLLTTPILQLTTTSLLVPSNGSQMLLFNLTRNPLSQDLEWLKLQSKMRLWSKPSQPSAGITSHGRNTSTQLTKATNGTNPPSQRSTRNGIPTHTSSHTTKETTPGTMPSTTNPMRLSSLITPRLLMPITLRTSTLPPNTTWEKAELVLPLRMKYEIELKVSYPVFKLKMNYKTNKEKIICKIKSNR